MTTACLDPIRMKVGDRKLVRIDVPEIDGMPAFHGIDGAIRKSVAPGEAQPDAVTLTVTLDLDASQWVTVINTGDLDGPGAYEIEYIASWTGPGSEALAVRWPAHGELSAVLEDSFGPSIPPTPGNPGESDSQTFTNSALWVMHHSLGYQPAVTVVDVAGQVIIADIDYVSPTEIHVTHAAPTSGAIYLS